MAVRHRRIFTRDSPLSVLVEILDNRDPFSNSTQSWSGRPVTPLEVARIMQSVGERMRTLLTTDTSLAFMLDEPDYIIVFRDLPIGWHSSNRAATSAATVPGPNPERYEWVVAEVVSGAAPRNMRQPYGLTRSAIDTINSRKDTVNG